jgi:hypothetical protein
MENFYMSHLLELGNTAMVSGRYLAHNRLSRVERAFFAADLHAGTVQLVRPTIVQAAALAGVNATYVHWAIRQQTNRAAIVRGLLPLVPPYTKAGINDAKLFDIISTVGIDHLLAVAAAVEAQAHH